jgi:hypothetical protein
MSCPIHQRHAHGTGGDVIASIDAHLGAPPAATGPGGRTALAAARPKVTPTPEVPIA